MSTPTMVLTLRNGEQTRHHPDESMTFGLSLNEPYEQSLRLPVPHHHGEEYVRDYNRGWRARPGAAAFDSATGSVAYDDGYMDANAGREKWHLAWCDVHGTSGIVDCGRA